MYIDCESVYSSSLAVKQTSKTLLTKKKLIRYLCFIPVDFIHSCHHRLKKSNFILEKNRFRSINTGRVEKTDPRSADYPLTPAPRTTLQTTPRTTLRTTLRTTPTDYPKKSTKFLLRSTKIQKAYLLFQHDHNCTKNSRHFLFLHFSTQFF